jgi:multidrug resistance efflux pump
LNGKPDPDKLEVAEKKLKAAEWEVKAAQKAVDDLSLKAPFDGIVSRLDIKVGELTPSTKPAVQFADTSRWMVETTNLTEIQVVKIEIGQKATIKADALPDESFIGVVRSISDTYEEKQGDVTYTVKVELHDASPKFRWGMTVVATFNENQ